MIWPLAILLGCQLAGEVLVRIAGLPVPGPVAGMVLLLVGLLALPRLHAAVAPTGNVILANLSLLFVPAGVGVVAHLDTLSTHGVGLMMAPVVSTVLALIAAVLTFRLVARLLEPRA